MKEWDFGWFGKGIIGDLHYKQAFDRSYAAGRTPGPLPCPALRPRPKPVCGAGNGLVLPGIAAALLFFLLFPGQPTYKQRARAADAARAQLCKKPLPAALNRTSKNGQ